MSDVRTIIAIDQGTTSSRAILFDEEGTILAQQSAELPQHFPADGWVEHNPEDIWRTTVDVTSAIVAKSQSLGLMPVAIGITNQRETAIVWDRNTGKPIHNAIVWQDRRTADICAAMKNAGSEVMVKEKLAFAGSLFHRHKTLMDSRQRRGRAGPRGQRRTVFRHRR